MKPDKFLLVVLWILAMTLAAEFWFGIKFNFDLLSASHWQNLGVLQASGIKISKMFYVSLVFAALIFLVGLYAIMRPKFRKIEKPLKSESIENDAITAIKEESVFTQQDIVRPTDASVPQRPPRLNLSDASRMPSRVPMPVPENSLPTPAPVPQKKAIPETPPHIIYEVQQIFNNAGFMVKKNPTIAGVRTDLFAIGTDEVLWIGMVCNQGGEITAKEGGSAIWESDNGEKFDSPVQRLAGATTRINSLFEETLDEDLKITVKSFVLMNGGNVINPGAVRAVWDAFDISVVSSMQELSGLVGMNRPVPESEKEDFQAFSDYIDTAAGYLNKESET